MEKEKIIPGRKESSVPPAMIKLLQDYLTKRTDSENLSEDYYVLGREVWINFDKHYIFVFSKIFENNLIWIKKINRSTSNQGYSIDADQLCLK